MHPGTVTLWLARTQAGKTTLLAKIMVWAGSASPWAPSNVFKRTAVGYSGTRHTFIYPGSLCRELPVFWSDAREPDGQGDARRKGQNCPLCRRTAGTFQEPLTGTF